MSSPGPRPTKEYLGSFAFMVKVEGFDTEYFGFTSCSGIKSVSEVFDFKHGMDTHVRKHVGRTSYEPVTLERVYAGLDEFAMWRDRIEAGNLERRNIIIEYRTSNHTPVSRFRLQNAFPARWETPDLNAMSSDPGIERIEIEFERVVREFSGQHLGTDWDVRPFRDSVSPTAAPEAPKMRDSVSPGNTPWWVRTGSTGNAKEFVRDNKGAVQKRRAMNYPDWVTRYG